MSAIVNVGATLYVTVTEPPAGMVNVPVVRPVLTPPTAIAVTVPPVIVTLTATGFGFSAGTVVAASVIAVVNIDGAAATTALAESRIAPASTKWLAPDASWIANGASAYLLATGYFTSPRG